MRKLLWMVILFCAYVWVVTSGREQFVIQQGKALYQAVLTWLEGAEFDFQYQPKEESKKKSRRWD